MIDNKTIKQAKNADIIAFLEKYQGFTFAHRGGAYRCQQHQSLAVKADRLSFYWHSRGIGGFGALDYLTKIENIPFLDAVSVITGVTPITAPPKREAEPPKTLVLPEKAGVQLRLYDYLCIKRSIDSDIIQTLIQKEMLYEDRRGNVVFIGHDEHGKPRFACLRGTHGDYRGDCAGSDKRYGFHTTAIVHSERLYIYESAIDLMSHADLENLPFDTTVWREHHRLSLSGTSDTAIPFFLNQHKEVKELVFCLDNDTPGREAAVNLARKYADKCYRTRLEFPTNKDFNEDLQAFSKQIHTTKNRNHKHDICI